jgi:hypothetical protein
MLSNTTKDSNNPGFSGKILEVAENYSDQRKENQQGLSS